MKQGCECPSCESNRELVSLFWQVGLVFLCGIVAGLILAAIF